MHFISWLHVVYSRGYYGNVRGARGQRRGWGQGQKQGRSWRGGRQSTTRAQLDAQLDQYMTLSTTD